MLAKIIKVKWPCVLCGEKKSTFYHVVVTMSYSRTNEIVSSPPPGHALC